MNLPLPLLGTRTALVLALPGMVTLACGGAPNGKQLSSLRMACPQSQSWNGTSCIPWGLGGQRIAGGETALEEGEHDRAAQILGAATSEGPHRHETHVRLYEQLGIAHSFREDEVGATSAFTTLLLLSPLHILSYKLSPRATLKFQKAREAVLRQPLPALDISLPIGNDVGRPVRIKVGVVADPAKKLSAATLFVSNGVGGPKRAADFELPEAGARTEVVLPPVGGEKPTTLNLHLVARDETGNEVLVWASESQPRQLALDYQPPTPLLKKWWFWAAVGGVVAVSTAATAYALTRPLPDFVDGGASIE